MQRRRKTIIVPPSRRRLHTYANLYFNPRNIVGYRFKMDTIDAGGSVEELCMVRLSLDALDLDDVIVTDRNAAGWPQSMTPDAGIATLDHDDLFATYWSNKDHAQRMCAEVLVPDSVSVEYITDVIVPTSAARTAAQTLCGEVRIRVKGSLFFL